MSHQLINFYIPTGLKDQLDEIAKAKRLSRTAIINQLLDNYCRNVLQEIAWQSKNNNSTNSRSNDDDDGMPLTTLFDEQDRFNEHW